MSRSPRITSVNRHQKAEAATFHSFHTHTRTHKGPAGQLGANKAKRHVKPLNIYRINAIKPTHRSDTDRGPALRDERTSINYKRLPWKCQRGREMLDKPAGRPTDRPDGGGTSELTHENDGRSALRSSPESIQDPGQK